MKKLGNLPHRMPMTNPDHRLRNMPWVSGNEKIFGLLKTAYRLRSMDIGSTFLRAGETPDGIYIIINGTVNLKTPIAVKDHERFGEIYNTDNIKTIYDDSFVTMRGRTGSVELALPGNALNEQALLIGFKRRADAVAETKVDVLFIPAEGLFEAFKLAPELEKLMWKHIVVSVVINMELRMKAFNVRTNTWCLVDNNKNSLSGYGLWRRKNAFSGWYHPSSKTRKNRGRARYVCGSVFDSRLSGRLA